MPHFCEVCGMLRDNVGGQQLSDFSCLMSVLFHGLVRYLSGYVLAIEPSWWLVINCRNTEWQVSFERWFLHF